MKQVRQYSEEAIARLNQSKDYAEDFVYLRMELAHHYLKGRILSTNHGPDIFRNILQCLDGRAWTEKGELGDSFQDFIEESLKAESK